MNKYTFKDLVVYRNIVYSIGTIINDRKPFSYTIYRVFPKEPFEKRLENIREEYLSLWDGKVVQ